MQKLTLYIDKVLSLFLMFLMGMMVLTVSWQVITRFILPHPSSFTEELARFLLIWIGVLGASYALRTKAHLGIDILNKKLTGSRARLLNYLVYSCIILFALFIMIVGGYRLVDLTFTLHQISAAMGIPMGYIYLVVPLSGALMIYYSIFAMIYDDSLETHQSQEGGL
jgi:TRAP-type C4-dicarboxylate transport system permease small subunit